MELIERLPLVKIHYLDSLSFKQYKDLNIGKSTCKNDAERKIQFNIMKSFCQTNIKTRGETKRIYSYTEKTPLEVGGRLYCGNSIQGLSSKIRGFLLRDITTDIDMKNAHPVILKYLCKMNKIDCPDLSYYIENRDAILERLGKEFKTEFLKAVNDDKLNKKIKDEFFKSFDKECKSIQKQITSLSCYKHIVDSVPTSREYNWLGSATNRILCVYENYIIQEVISVLNKNQTEICAMMFDGLMAYGKFYNNLDLLQEITDFVNAKFENLEMKFTYKEHSDLIQLPDDFTIPDKSKKEDTINDKSFENVALHFEQNHLKIINKAFFIKEFENKIIVLNDKQIKSAYSHLVYEKEQDTKDGVKTTTKGFISDWLDSNPKQKRKDDIGIYPTGMECPENYYNLWRPFQMELVTEYVEMKDELDIILKHIKILCGNDKVVYDYFIKWISQMIQYPAIKSICPTLISKEGAGKGTLMRLLCKML